MITIIDIENKVTFKDKGKLDLSPYNTDNRLVSVGWQHLVPKEGGGALYDASDYIFLYHNEKDRIDPRGREKIQRALDATTLLVGHNIKHDLEWLLECGYRYTGDTYCTMVAEYVLARGLKWPMGLDDALERYGLERKQTKLIKEYLDQNITFDNIPANLVEEYGRADVNTTAQLFIRQQKEYEKRDNQGLRPTRRMMNEFLWVIIDIQRNGIKIDLEELDRVEKELTEELGSLRLFIDRCVADVMGDTPININSPEQLSMVLYSRRVLDKPTWSDIFNLGMEQRGAAKKPKRRPKMGDVQFVQNVRALTEVVYKTKAEQCTDCGGQGAIYPITKSGRPSKVKRYCGTCKGQGYIYHNTGQVAGYRVTPTGVGDIAAGGFSTDGDTLDGIALRYPERAGLVEFVRAIGRANQLDTYLSTFCQGIRNAVRSDGLLHTELLQCVTATGRLSSRNPNFQNQPRGGTFPVRRVVKSRWANGKILEADYKGLEYRVAVELAQDEAGIHDILHKVDPHVFTAQHTKFSRQDSKPHTFAPLYGATDQGKPPTIAAYYRAFMAKHKGVAKWQEELQDEAIRTKKIVLPSGREYAFPFAKRTGGGGSTFATQIKNYPVQGFATADVVPCAGICLRYALAVSGARSLVILTVHDSYLVDVHPDELEWVPKLVYETLNSVRDELLRRYGYKFKVPIEVEMKIGNNWLDGKELVP